MHYPESIYRNLEKHGISTHFSRQRYAKHPKKQETKKPPERPPTRSVDQLWTIGTNPGYRNQELKT